MTKSSKPLSLKLLNPLLFLTLLFGGLDHSMIGTSQARAERAVRIGVTNEVGGIPGLVGNGWSSFKVFTEPESLRLILSGVQLPGLGPVRKMVEYTLVVENVGDEAVEFVFPLMRNWWGTLAVGAFTEVSLSDTNGNVVREQFQSTPFVWDYLPVGEGAGAPVFGVYGMFGLSPGYAVWDEWQELDVTGVPDGRYLMRVVMDPLGFWGLGTEVAVWVELEANQMRPAPSPEGVGL